MKTSKSLEKMFSPRQVGEMLGLHKGVVLEKIGRGEISPVFRLNARVIRVPESTLNAYLAARTLAIGAQPADA